MPVSSTPVLVKMAMTPTEHAPRRRPDGAQYAGADAATNLDPQQSR